jgi:hypothetical protein
MEEKNELWNETPNIFVAFLDIMGFKDRVFREKHEDILKSLRKLRSAIVVVEQDAEERLRDKKQFKEKREKKASNTSCVFPISFSDSIVLFTNDDSDDSAEKILNETNYIFSSAIACGIPMKGSIAFGEMTVDTKHSLYFGQPLIDAYELHKELQIYGVVIHHTAQKQFELLKNKSIFELLVLNSSVPLKSGTVNHSLTNGMFFEQNPIEVVDALYRNVSGQPRKYVDNTLKFITETKQKQLEIVKKAKIIGIIGEKK